MSKPTAKEIKERNKLERWMVLKILEARRLRDAMPKEPDTNETGSPQNTPVGRDSA